MVPQPSASVYEPLAAAFLAWGLVFDQMLIHRMGEGKYILLTIARRSLTA